MKIGPCHHKYRGEAYYSEQCAWLQARNPDPSSIFVEINREITEVTKALVTQESCDAP